MSSFRQLMHNSRSSAYVLRLTAVFLLRTLLVFSVISVTPLAYAENATLFLSPIAGTALLDESFPVTVFISTGGETVNAVEGGLSFDPDDLAVKEIVTENSKVSSWTVPPSFDNASGTITWSGIIPVGLTGDRIPILTVSLLVKRATETRLRFDRGAAVHSADGAGTNILTDMKSGVYAGVPRESLPASTDVPDQKEEASQEGEGAVLGVATGTPDIQSSTHPEVDSWSKGKEAAFSWSIDSSVVAVRTGIDHSPKSNPLREFRPPISERRVDDIDDGIWYFHLARDFDDGTSQVLHRKIGMDNVPPEGVTLTVDAPSDPVSPRRELTLVATDTLSGLERVVWKIDGIDVDTIKQQGNDRYVAEGLLPGERTVTADVYDRAGNVTSATSTFTVALLPAPVIMLDSEYPSEGESLVFSGKATPQSRVRVSLLRSGDTQPVVEEVQVENDGTFRHKLALKAEPGAYQYWASAENKEKAKSKDSEKGDIIVTASFMGVLSRHPMILVAAALLIILIGIGWFALRRLRGDVLPEAGVDDVQTPRHPSFALNVEKDDEKKEEEPAIRGRQITQRRRPEVSGGVIRL